MSTPIKTFPAPVRDFIAAIKARAADREQCRTCPLAGRPVVVLDTNVQAPGPVDVAFLGLNPGAKEVEQDRPFVGPAGQLLRARLEALRPGSRWLITNVLLSHTRNEAEIPRPDVAMAHCRELVEAILAAFPPRLLVPTGAKPMKWCGVPDAVGRMTQVGETFAPRREYAAVYAHKFAAFQRALKALAVYHGAAD